MRDPRLGVELRLALAIPLLRVRRDDLDDQKHVTRLVGRLFRCLVRLGADDADIRFRPLAWAKYHAHLAACAQPPGQMTPQSRCEEIDSSRVKGGLGAHEDQASINQLCVRRKLRHVIEVGRLETFRRRKDPARETVRVTQWRFAPCLCRHALTVATRERLAMCFPGWRGARTLVRSQ
ncbi:hypothetical protein Mro03_16850 [Microbispora rosea subsp. rosea]|nr:hypothetical protein Mro03_16850 [Microbispora rosea subsp. rosea]